MDNLIRDLRFALRSLARSRGFTLAAVVCLGLGMGATTAIYSVVDAVLFEPLPFTEPERVVVLWNQFLLQDTPKAPASGREFLDLQEQSTVFASLAALAPQFVSLSGGDEPRELLAARATAGLFPALGWSAAVGRVFTPEEDVFGRHEVALLGDALWRERFGADPRIVGRPITLDGKPYVVTGVLPPGHDFGGYGFDLWLPQGLSRERLMPRHIRTLTLVGRLAPGVELERAQAEMDLVAARFARDYPEAYPEGSGWGIRVVPAYEDLVGDVRTTLLVLFGAVGLVLAIACANVANLLLARATARSKEVAIRTALGSSRRTLVWHFLLEGLVLSALGAAAGLLLAVWGTRALAARGPVEIPRLDQAQVDGGVLLFTGALVLLTGVAFGLVPVLHSARRDLRSPLQEGGRTSAAAGRHRGRSAVVVVEIAVAAVVLVGAGLMIKSFSRMLAVDPGFRAEGVLTAPLTLPRPRYPEDAQVVAFERRLLERVASVAGVTAAAVASQVPMRAGADLSGDLEVEGRVVGPSEPPPTTGWRIVSPGYFAAMRIPLRGGRDFTAADDESAPGVVIVDEELARRLWPGEEPLGKRLRLNGRTPQQSVWRTVVGVAGRVRQHGLAEAEGDQLYVPLAQYPYRLLHLVARTAAAPEALAGALREAVWSVDRDLPFTVQTVAQVIGESLRRPRFNTFLFTVFGGIAFTLTAVGVYGVMAYSVSQRTRDLGIRIALGARAADVLREVVAQGALLALAGIALGLAAAWSLSRLMATLLYGVTSTDLATFLAVPLALGAMALAASFFPARRAARVDPVEALRDA